jgi:hypothetical protein
MIPRVLKVYTPVALGEPSYVTTVKGDVGWARTTRRLGGFWRGKFTMRQDPDNPGQLLKWFYEFLGNHFVEISAGGVTWEGMIYEMDYANNGIIRRRSLDLMWNRAWSKYKSERNQSEALDTEIAENLASQARYGVREEMLLLDGYDLEDAESERDTFLAERAFPAPWVVGTDLKRGRETRLDVVVAGYVFTTNWLFVTALPDLESPSPEPLADDISNWAREILELDCPFLKIGSIQENTRQKRKVLPVPQRAFDVLTELARVGGTALEPWRFHVGTDRRANYVSIPKEPEYFIRGGDVYTSAGARTAVSPWKVRPAVFRDTDYLGRKLEIDTWLDDGRDFYVGEVEYGDGYTQPILKTELFLESEILAAQHQAQEQQKQDAKAKGGEHVDTWHKFRPGHPKWGSLTAEEQKYIEDHFMKERG